MGSKHLTIPFVCDRHVAKCRFIGVAWAFGAFWFDFPFSALRRPLAVVFGLGAIGALGFVRPRWRAQVAVAAAIALVAVWDLTISPSNTRDWQPQVAEPPYVEIDGDRVVIHNFRNFDYFSKTDFRPRWETKTVQLSHLRTVDFFTNFWGPKLICHTGGGHLLACRYDAFMVTGVTIAPRRRITNSHKF